MDTTILCRNALAFDKKLFKLCSGIIVDYTQNTFMDIINSIDEVFIMGYPK